LLSCSWLANTVKLILLYNTVNLSQYIKVGKEILSRKTEVGQIFWLIKGSFVHSMSFPFRNEKSEKCRDTRALTVKLMILPIIFLIDIFNKKKVHSTTSNVKVSFPSILKQKYFVGSKHFDEISFLLKIVFLKNLERVESYFWIPTRNCYFTPSYVNSTTLFS